jgi:hypothetical protein
VSAVTDRIETILQVQLPGILVPTLRLELYLTVDELCRQALQIPVGDAGAALDQWISDDLWAQHQRLIIDGALARLFAQIDKPWSRPEMAAVHVGFWDAGLAAARVIAATAPAPAGGYGRILANLRTAIPAARDDALRQELFNTVDEFTRSVLQTTPPVSTAAPEAWLSDALYTTHFRLLMAGTLARLLLQPGKPWSDTALAAVHAGMWDSAIVLARADFEDKAVTDPWQLLMENLRTQLPGCKDSQIRLELFNTVDEACRTVNLWTQTVAVPLIEDHPTYRLAAPAGDIIEVVDVSHASMILTDTVFDPISLYLDLGRDPDEKDLHTPVFVMLRLAPLRTNDVASYLPGNLWAQHHQLLLDGVLGRMMAQPAKPYSSPKLAEYHLRRFRNALQEVRVATTGGGTAWRFPSAATRRTRR